MRAFSTSPSSLAWAIALLTAVGSGCSACPSESARDATPETKEREATASGRTLVLGTLSEPDTLDPVFSETAAAREIIDLLFRDLVVYDADWQLAPAMAEGLPETRTSSSGAIARWRLRAGSRWSDGTPVSAADAVFAHEIMTRPDLASGTQAHLDPIRGLRALDARTLEVSWAKRARDVALPRLHVLLPAHAYPEAKPPNFHGMGRAPIASGPFQLESWVPGQSLSVVPNPGWSGAKPQIERITWRFFQSEDSFEAELRTGGIDGLGEASGLSLGKAKGLEKRLAKSHAVHFTESGVWLHLSVRHDHPALGRSEVRRALSLAIDREQMAQLVYEGEATASASLFPPRHPAASSAKPEYDLVEAKRLLADVEEKDRELTLLLASGSQASERAGTFLESSFAKIGVRMRIQSLPFRVMMKKLRDGEQPALTLMAWRLSPDWDGVPVVGREGARNFGGFSDPEMDARLDAVLDAPTRPAWVDALRLVDARFRETLPLIPLLVRKSASVRPSWLEGWQPTGTITPVTWTAENWRDAR